MPAKRMTKTRSSTTSTKRRSATQSTNRNAKRNPKKKQDNTKLFIGLGVGAFFLLIIIIAAASGGNSAPTGKSSLSADFLTVNQRKEIYSKYNQEYDAIESDAMAKMANLSMEDRRTNGRTIQKIKGRQQAYLPDKMYNIFSQKYKGITVEYIRKYVIQAGDAQQW